MARIRSIKPEFWTDSFMVQIPHLARLLYIALWTAADDHGFLKDEPERLAMELMPRENAALVDNYIQLLHASGRLEMYADDQGTYYRISKWESHQKVDKPTKSRIFRESSRKVAISNDLRRKIAQKYGCSAGEAVPASCFYCGAEGEVYWHKLSDGRASGWVTFPSLEIEHLECEVDGGETSIENMVLSCRHCNRSKGRKHWVEAVGIRSSDNPRELSRMFSVGKEEERKRKGEDVEANASSAGAPSAEILSMPVDARKALFGEALPLLAKYVGKPENSMRALVGKWLKAASDDAAKVSRIIAETVRDERADPVSWIERCLKPADPDEAIYRNVL